MPLILLTGCGKDSISDRLYTRTLGIGGSQELTLYAQTFNEEEGFSASGMTVTDALVRCESDRGSRILTGHTELLCLDGNVTFEACRDLLFEQGLSPSCKVCFVRLHSFFQSEDGSTVQERIRMSEENGQLGAADLASLLNEWCGAGGTALLPAASADSMVLLHKDGTVTKLSEEAARGMYWLRRGKGALRITLSADGEKRDVKLLGCTLQKKVSEEGQLHFLLTVRDEDCPEAWRSVLAETLLSQCRTAVTEMQDVHADVIGIEDLLASADLSFDPAQFPEIKLEVRIQ